MSNCFSTQVLDTALEKAHNKKHAQIRIALKEGIPAKLQKILACQNSMLYHSLYVYKSTGGGYGVRQDNVLVFHVLYGRITDCHLGDWQYHLDSMVNIVKSQDAEARREVFKKQSELDSISKRFG